MSRVFRSRPQNYPRLQKIGPHCTAPICGDRRLPHRNGGRYARAMMTRNFWVGSIVVSSLFVACGDNGGGDGDGDDCPDGTLGCECSESDDCAGSLVCDDGICVEESSAGSGGSESGGTGGNGSPSGGTSSGGNDAGDGDGDSSGGTDAGDGDGDAGGNQGGGSGDGDAGGNQGGGSGDGDGDGDGDGCDEDGDFPTFQIQARSDTGAGWDDNDFDDVEFTVDECGIATISAEWPHEVGWENDDPGEANMESTKFSIEFLMNNASLAGKQLNLKMRLTQDGRGTSATNGGYDVYLGAVDSSGFTEVATPHGTGEFYNAGQVVDMNFVVPAAGGDFDPASIYKINVRIASKFWGNGSDPVFDYEVAEFELISLTITDAP